MSEQKEEEQNNTSAVPAATPAADDLKPTGVNGEEPGNGAAANSMDAVGAALKGWWSRAAEGTKTAGKAIATGASTVASKMSGAGEGATAVPAVDGGSPSSSAGAAAGTAADGASDTTAAAAAAAAAGPSTGDKIKMGAATVAQKTSEMAATVGQKTSVLLFGDKEAEAVLAAERKVHERWIGRCIELAAKAKEHGEFVNAGVLVGMGDEELTWADDATRSTGDPTQHAAVAIVQKFASETAGDLSRVPASATLYTVLEPCSLCCGAVLCAKYIKRVVFAVPVTRQLRSAGHVLPCRHLLLEGGIHVAGPIGWEKARQLYLTPEELEAALHSETEGHESAFVSFFKDAGTKIQMAAGSLSQKVKGGSTAAAAAMGGSTAAAQDNATTPAAVDSTSSSSTGAAAGAAAAPAETASGPTAGQDKKQ